MTKYSPLVDIYKEYAEMTGMKARTSDFRGKGINSNCYEWEQIPSRLHHLLEEMVVPSKTLKHMTYDTVVTKITG